jgi:hypothetical protein
VFRAFRQALARAVERNFATVNASNGIKNPKRKRHERREILPFETWAKVESVADEFDQRYRAIPSSRSVAVCDQKSYSRSNGATSTGRTPSSTSVDASQEAS